jgi:hypothetical protein
VTDPNEDDDEGTIEVRHGSAGEPQRPMSADDLAHAADIPALSPADLDARQEEIGERRRSGPPLPEGEVSEVAAMDDASVVDEPTEVEEPRSEDR